MKLNHKGFTLIELMIATTVLSVLLVLIASVSIQVGRLFYKGVSSSRTQETVRSITDQISRNIQYSSVTPEDNANVICVAGNRYSYQVDNIVSKNTHALWVDNQTEPCVALSQADMNSETPPSDGKELIPGGMRLTKFKLTKPDASNERYWEIEVGVALGEEDLLQYSGPPADPDRFVTGCVTTNEGGQFCDVAELKVGVYRWKD